MVDILLVPGKYAKTISLSDSIIDKLPHKLMLFASVQFLDQLSSIEAQLVSKGRDVLMEKSRNYLYEGLISNKGQLLGCNMEDFQAKHIDFDAFLYIGDGLFHPKALLVNNHKDIYCYDPKTLKLNKLDKSLHMDYVKRKKGSRLKFLSSENIGIIMTTKKGQGNPLRAELLRKNILKKWPEKKVFMFYAAEVDFSELENFNFIDIYVNTACSRIGHDDTTRSEKAIINISDVEILLDG